MRLTTSHRQTGGGALSGRRISRPMAIAGVAAGLLLTFVLDRGTGSAPFQHLYYLPIIFAAFTLNWGGGLAASLCAIVLYHLANPALLAFGYHEPDFVQMTLFVAVGVVTATLTANARRLHAMAMTDDLTGLHNLRSFEGELRRLIHAMRSSAGPMSLMVLDLDRLKSLNDTHGHLTGAEAVRTVGHILGSHLPADAVACRYGGDEFVVALPRRSEADVLGIAEGSVALSTKAHRLWPASGSPLGRSRSAWVWPIESGPWSSPIHEQTSAQASRCFVPLTLPFTLPRAEDGIRSSLPLGQRRTRSPQA